MSKALIFLLYGSLFARKPWYTKESEGIKIRSRSQCLGKVKNSLGFFFSHKEKVGQSETLQLDLENVLVQFYKILFTSLLVYWLLGTYFTFYTSSRVLNLISELECRKHKAANVKRIGLTKQLLRLKNALLLNPSKAFQSKHIWVYLLYANDLIKISQVDLENVLVQFSKNRFSRDSLKVKFKLK